MEFFGGIRYGVLDPFVGTPTVEKNNTENSIILDYPCQHTNICTPYIIKMPPGTYKIELWGAQGGDARYLNTPNIRPNSGGKGAYVSGTLRLKEINTFYVFVGGKGEDQESYHGNVVSIGGFNGGGNGGGDRNDNVSPESSAAGGGSTDIRLYPDDSLKALKSRIIVAGAGGGSSSVNETYNYATYFAGNGGTTTGISFSTFQIPGNQTSGIFGKGQNGTDFDSSFYILGGSTGGSGSGYYGGLTVDGRLGNLTYYEIPGAGGSSYISGHSECNSVENNDSNPPTHTGESIHYSDFFFRNTEMRMFGFGNFTDPHGNPENGHSGNGVAKITIIEAHTNGRFFYTQSCITNRINYLASIFITLTY
jgi:hypothetical protein